MNMTSVVFDKIKDILVLKKGIPADSIHLESSFEELGMDSLDAVELLADLEDAFSVDIPNSELQHFKTIQQAVNGIEEAISK
jgi:acyl carrier protein